MAADPDPPPPAPRPEADASQRVFAAVSLGVTLAACLAALAAPALLLWFPGADRPDHPAMFGALFQKEPPARVWRAGGVDFADRGFWGLIRDQGFGPDGLALAAIALGCSVTLWALLPTAWVYWRRRDFKYAALALALAGLTALAMSGWVRMEG